MQDIMGAIISAVIAIIAAVPGILALHQQRKKQDAEVAELISKASAQLISQYERRMTEMEDNDAKHRDQFSKISEEVQDLKMTIQQRDYVITCRDNYIEHLLNGIKRLIAQLVSMNVTPVWQPEDCRNFFEKRYSEDG